MTSCEFYMSICTHLLLALLVWIGQAVCARTQVRDHQRELGRI